MRLTTPHQSIPPPPHDFKTTIRYMDETSALEDAVTFCTHGDVSHVSECYATSTSSGKGSATGSGHSGESYASGSGSGKGTSSNSTVEGGSGYASGGGSMTIEGGRGSASGSGSSGVDVGTSFASGEGSMRPSNGTGTASGEGTVTSSSATGSATGEGGSAGNSTGTGSASGGEGVDRGSGQGSASGSEKRGGGDVPGCSCDDVVLESAEAEFFCESNKSMYCDVECLPDSDPLDRLFYDMGGLWCKPFGWEGCRLCHMDCANYGDKYCVPCPPDVQGWCV